MHFRFLPESKTKGDSLEMKKRNALVPQSIQAIFAELFTEDSFEQHLKDLRTTSIRTLLGLSFRPRRRAFKKPVAPTTDF